MIKVNFPSFYSFEGGDLSRLKAFVLFPNRTIKSSPFKTFLTFKTFSHATDL
jgi:hypothetical protein